MVYCLPLLQVGLPNVGKSSVINSLKRTRVAQVSGSSEMMGV